MDKTDNDFALFQKYFSYYQKKFGLTGYKVYFKYESLDSVYADITCSPPGKMVATVRLNSNLPEEDNVFKDIKRSAKHEALHLLLSRLENNGRYRFSSEDEITESCEELVNKLEILITS